MDGLRVVTVEQAVAAPLCTRHLADLGADVVKIERPDGGDFARGYDETVWGYASHFVWLNYGKRSLALDLKAPEGRDILRELVRTADVFVSNLAPGATERLLPDTEAASLNSRLVRCRISGYGDTGPYADRKAFDLLIQGEAGITLATGTPEVPAKSGVSLADLAGGIYGLASISAALIRRQTTGRGELVEIALLDVMADWMMPLLMAQRYAGTVPPPAGTRHATIAPYGAYATADGTMVNIAVQNDGQWRRLCTAVLGEPELATDSRFVTNSARIANRRELEARVTAALARQEAADLRDLLARADVPWGDLNDLPRVLDHPQLASRERWHEVALPDARVVSVVRSPLNGVKSESTPMPRVPRLGEHGPMILHELGCDERRIADLIARGVVGAS